MGARRRYGWGEAKIARRLAEGCGQGEGSSYKPWLTVRDVPSLGASRSHRIPCTKTGRVSHLLSDLEAGAFMLAWFDDAVLDIREQYPLSRAATVQIASDLGIRHPRDRQTGCFLVQTTDLLLTIQGPRGRRLEAWAVKSEADLAKPRTLEKLDLERHLWGLLGVPWRLKTERHTRTPFTANLAWLLDAHSAAPPQMQARIAELERHLAGAIAASPLSPLKAICLAFDRAEELVPGTALEFARRMLAGKRLLTDLNLRHPQEMPGSAFAFSPRAA